MLIVGCAAICCRRGGSLFFGFDEVADVGEDSAALVQGGGADAAAGAQLCYRAEPAGTDGHGHDSR